MPTKLQFPKTGSAGCTQKSHVVVARVEGTRFIDELAQIGISRQIPLEFVQAFIWRIAIHHGGHQSGSSLALGVIQRTQLDTDPARSFGKFGKV